MIAPLLTLIAGLGAAAGFGLGWLRLLGGREPLNSVRLLQAIGLGLGTLAYLILALGLTALLSPGTLVGLAVSGWGLAIPLGVVFRRLERSAPRQAEVDASAPQEERLATLGLLAFLGLVALMTFASVLRPADGGDWDGLSYHLAVPKIYLREGKIPFIAYDSHSHFPFTLEMLFTFGLQFGGTAGAKSFHWACGWLTAAAIGAWTARLNLGTRRPPLWAGPLAAGVFITMPIVLWELGVAYVDLGTALFQFLALAAVVDAVERTDEGWELRRPGELVVAGMLSGFALGTKYTALLQFGLLGLGLVLCWLRSPAGARGAWVRGLLGFGLVGILVGSPWYIKNWLWVHNPVYPFFFSLFPQSYSWTRHAEIAYQTEQRSFGLGRGPAEALGVFWNLGMHGRAFYINQRSLVGDRLGSLGVVWAGAAPLLLWMRSLPWRLVACLAYGGASIAAWFVLSQQARYLLPVFAPLAVPVALLPVLLPARFLRGAAGAFLALCLLLNVQMHLPLFQDTMQVVSGQVSEQSFLEQTLPGVFEASQYVNTLPPSVRVALYQETRGYYLDRPYFWANPLQHNLIPYDALPDGRALARELRRFRITHVFINYDFCRGVEAAAWYRLLMDAIREGVLRETFRSRSASVGQRGVIVYELEVDR